MTQPDDRFYKDANLYAADKVGLARELSQKGGPTPPKPDKLIERLRARHLDLFEAFVAGATLAKNSLTPEELAALEAQRKWMTWAEKLIDRVKDDVQSAHDEFLLILSGARNEAPVKKQIAALKKLSADIAEGPAGKPGHKVYIVRTPEGRLHARDDRQWTDFEVPGCETFEAVMM